MYKSKYPIFDYNICIACGICVTVCPISVLELKKCDVDVYKTAFPVLINDRCIGCCLCLKSCPMDAIKMK